MLHFKHTYTFFVFPDSMMKETRNPCSNQIDYFRKRFDIHYIPKAPEYFINKPRKQHYYHTTGIETTTFPFNVLFLPNWIATAIRSLPLFAFPFLLLPHNSPFDCAWQKDYFNDWVHLELLISRSHIKCHSKLMVNLFEDFTRLKHRLLLKHYSFEN